MADLDPGSIFAGYRIERVAGRGGMGLVYQATQLGLERSVALKVIASDFAEDAEFRERFKRESRLAASIDHPNVIPVYEAGEAEGRLFIAMRFVDGTDLRALIVERGRMAPEEAVGIVSQVAAALDAAHRHGLVHRDVKPANVLVTGSGEEQHVYLTDFGLVKRSDSGSALTRTGQFVGTADYVAPEQIEGKPADARADVYALGCVLFHALAGVVPFKRESEVATIYAHLSEPPPLLRDTVPGLPDELDDVVKRALAKSPEERFPSAGDLARAARGGGPTRPEASVAAGPASPPTAAAETRTRAAPEAPTRSPEATARTPRGADGDATRALGEPGVPDGGTRGRGRMVALSVLAGALLIGAVVALAGILGGGDEEGEGTPAADRERQGGTPRVIASIPVGGAPDGVAVEGNDVWFVDAERNVLKRVDVRTNKPVGKPVRVGRNPDGVTLGGGSAWVTNADDGTVSRVLLEGGPVAVAGVEVGGKPEGISLGKQLVWVVTGPAGTVNRLDRASATAVGAPIGAGADMIDVFVGDASVWATDQRGGRLFRIDTSDATLIGAPIAVGARPRGVVEARGSVWVANSGDGTVSRVNARSGKVSGGPIQVGKNPRDVAFGEGFVWVANTDSNSVSRIDPRSGRVEGQPISVGASPANVTVGAGSVWVTNTGDGTLMRIDPSG